MIRRLVKNGHNEVWAIFFTEKKNNLRKLHDELVKFLLGIYREGVYSAAVVVDGWQGVVEEMGYFGCILDS